MNMSVKKNTKRGSYIVEAVLVLPVFILAVIMLMSIIPVMGQCENVYFSVCDEMRKESVKAVYAPEPVTPAMRTAERIRNENRDVTACSINTIKYLYASRGMTDLITMEGKVTLEKKSLFSLYGRTEYDVSVTGRAFTGTNGKNTCLDEDEFKKKKKAEPVYVFPEYGEKYHKKNCTYLNACCEKRILNSALKKKYKPCKACRAGKARNGTTVYCFSKEGEVYHLGNCRHVKKAFVEMEKEDAIRKGYTPCSKCGG